MRTSSYKSNAIRAISGNLMPALLVCLGFCTTVLGTVLDEATEAFANARYQTAVRVLEKSGGKSAPESFLLGRSLFQLGQFDRASEVLERAVASQPKNATYVDWLGRAQGMRAEQANPFSAMGLARRARDSFQTAVSLDPKNVEAVNDLFSFYLAAPGFLGGGVEKARELAESIKAVDPGEYAFLQAQLAEKSKDYPGAERLYMEAQGRDPKKVGRWIDLAKFYTRRGMLEKADGALARAKALAPGAPRLLFDEASLLIRSERNLPKAKALLTKYQSSALSAEDPPPFEVQQLFEKLKKLGH